MMDHTPTFGQQWRRIVRQASDAVCALTSKLWNSIISETES